MILIFEMRDTLGCYVEMTDYGLWKHSESILLAFGERAYDGVSKRWINIVELRESIEL